MEKGFSSSEVGWLSTILWSSPSQPTKRSCRCSEFRPCSAPSLHMATLCCNFWSGPLKQKVLNTSCSTIRIRWLSTVWEEYSPHVSLDSSAIDWRLERWDMGCLLTMVFPLFFFTLPSISNTFILPWFCSCSWEWLSSLCLCGCSLPVQDSTRAFSRSWLQTLRWSQLQQVHMD